MMMSRSSDKKKNPSKGFWFGLIISVLVLGSSERLIYLFREITRGTSQTRKEKEGNAIAHLSHEEEEEEEENAIAHLSQEEEEEENAIAHLSHEEEEEENAIAHLSNEEEENAIAHLSHDIIFVQILNRFSSKTLVRLSCVSKLWYNTIHHDPFFIASHFNQSKSHPSLVVIYGGSVGIRFKYLDRGEQEEETSCILMGYLHIYVKFVVGSINGLTCICTASFIVICNPGTHEILSIPYPEDEFSHSCIYGFGFDPLMNVYKVVRIDCDDLVCKIFSLGAGDQDCVWRDVNVTIDVPLKECQEQERYNEYPFNYSNGALFKAIPQSNIIIKFDIHYEKFQVIPGLQVSQVSRSCFHLYSVCDFRGCPYAVYCEDLVGGYEFSLYALRKQKASSNCNVGRTYFVFEHAVRIPFEPKTISISFIEWSGKMLLQWIEDTATELCVYNQHTKRLQKLARIYLQGSPLLVVKHIDSLLSLKTLVPPSTLSSKGCRHLV